MLSGEGNAGERRKNNNRSNQQKSNFARAAHFFCTFLCRCFARPQRETSRNFFMEEMSCVFSFTFFFHCRSFSPCIGGSQHFSFCHRRYKIFMLFFKQKMSPLFFYLSLQISVALFLVEFRWPASFSLSFSGPIFQMCGHDNNLSLILQKTRIQKQFTVFGFVFIDSLVASALQTRVAMRFPS